MTQQVLITGASAGIGEAFARAYANMGANLILVARRKDRLESLATELREKHGIEINNLVVDLSKANAPQEIIKALVRKGLEVDVLVNNAGYGVPGTFVDNLWERHEASNQLMVTTVAELSHLLIPNMIKNRRGAVINVASIAGMIPATAGHTLYGAMKAWMIRFSEALADELEPYNIRVLAVCPGFTYSEFHDVTGTRDSVAKLPEIFWMSSKDVAEQSLAALEKTSRPIFVPGRFNRFLVQLNKYLPLWVVRSLISRNAKFARTSESN
ncbi:MAG: SDR family NAD(P)-dependent oxidoreductase [Gammaproteobacteria bacterium]